MQEIYLDNAATSKPHGRTLACAQQFVSLFTNPDKSASDITREMRGYLVSARETVARFIGCDADEVALVQNTTHGLGIIANAIPLEKDDNILCAIWNIRRPPYAGSLGSARLEHSYARSKASTALSPPQILKRPWMNTPV